MDGLVEHRHPSLDQALELLAAVRAEAQRGRSASRPIDDSVEFASAID
jgi:hypothetical protein